LFSLKSGHFQFIKIIADKLGLRVKAMDFDGVYGKSELFNAFANNTFDFIAATFEKSEELEARFEFTTPLYFGSFLDLRGLKICRKNWSFGGKSLIF
jgi:hypothetical protein